MAKLRQNIAVKSKLSSTLKSWLPILQSPIHELEETLGKIGEDNPFLEINSAFSTSLQENLSTKRLSRNLNPAKNSLGDKVELLTIYEKSLIESLQEQILPPLFPTIRSQQIALGIIDNLDEEGFFDCEWESFLEELKEFFLQDISLVAFSQNEYIKKALALIDEIRNNPEKMKLKMHLQANIKAVNDFLKVRDCVNNFIAVLGQEQ